MKTLLLPAAGLSATLKHVSHGSPDWSTVATVSASVIALLALACTVVSLCLARRAARAGDRSAAAAERAATATEEYVKIEQQLRAEASQPYVWVDVRPDPANGVLLNLMIGNSGSTIARNVHATIEPPLQAIDQLKDRAETAQDLLARGVSSMPPGRTLVWPLGHGFNLLSGSDPKIHKIVVTCDGPFGAVPPLTYVLDLLDWKGHMQHPEGSIHELTKVVDGISGKLSVGSRED